MRMKNNINHNIIKSIVKRGILLTKKLRNYKSLNKHKNKKVLYKR